MYIYTYIYTYICIMYTDVYIYVCVCVCVYCVHARMSFLLVFFRVNPRLINYM